jgi:histidyl-tRNA synthetase
MPLKYYYIISCFRHEKPQAGRSREFVQFGTEMFGSESPAADATAIALAASILKRLGLNNVKLHLNSIGCKECRPVYRQSLVSYYEAKRDKLCDTCRERLNKNPLRLLDCKNPECHELSITAPKTTENLCDACKSKFELLKASLDAMGIEYVVDSSIVRGLDYYTGAVFEFIAEGIGAQSTVCGGGRYDGLVESLGGPALSGIGFGMGITRLILALKALGLDKVEAKAPKLYVASLGEKAAVYALGIVERLRREGEIAECDIVGRSLKAQMKYANKLGAEYTLIIGDSEIESGKAQLRNMQTGEQKEVSLDGFTL